MKRSTTVHSLLAVVLLAGSAHPLIAQSHIENVLVEKYYISDANDSSDTISGGLTEGSITYRVFLDLDTLCALRAIYGDTNHALVITSTAPFFNHLDRGRTFGHDLNNSALDEGTVALDSWLSLGAASNQKFGVPKDLDPDGSYVGGSNNDGGSEEIPGGLLVNDDPDAGIPLTTADGLMPGTGPVTPPSFTVQGNDPANVFADSTLSPTFISYNTRVGCSTPGVNGPTTDNRILLGQFTTAGELAFELNVEVETDDGTIIHYVANDSILLADETASGLLVYPPQCGCMDPNFLEYDPNAGCDDGSCATPIIFGCLDTLACNYDPNANFNVAELCCYGPDSCNGLDITIICPDIGMDEIAAGPTLETFPNPASDRLHVAVQGPRMEEGTIILQDAMGRPVATATIVDHAEIDLTGLAKGPYVLTLNSSTARISRIVLKQ